MSFINDVDDFISNFTNEVKRVRKRAVIALTDSIIKDTPVDRGDLKASWVIKELGDSIYITNTQPYAIIAEFGLWNHTTEKTTQDGFSTQAPAGMVRINIKQFQKFVNQSI